MLAAGRGPQCHLHPVGLFRSLLEKRALDLALRAGRLELVLLPQARDALRAPLAEDL